MTPAEIESLFTRHDGAYAFARWGRPIVPIVFGVDDATLETVKGAIEAVVALAGHKMAETDPELGANLMFFFFREWDELLELPDLGRMIPNLDTLVGKLKSGEANQYRAFRFDNQGAIQAGFVFLKMDAELSRLPAETLALSQVVQAMLIWSDTAFAKQSPLAVVGEATILRPDIAGVIRAAYDTVMPVTASDPAHALRLYARVQAG
ncbi:MAG: hypothetical protein ACRBBS_14820 [Thalassovita sp.]